MADHECGGGEQHLQLRDAAEHGHSIYALTLEEIQRRLGSPLHGMNLDDVLSLVAAADASAAGIVAPPAPSEKTVVELWSDIQLGNSSKNGTNIAALGEMTLEVFLQKAAEKQRLQHSQQESAESAAEAFAEASSVQRPASNGGSTSARAGELRKRGGKRVAGEDAAELIEERRLKRMIKNRESAARSRARRQAYTNELENKILLLEEENRRLKKQEELDRIVDSVAQQDPEHHQHLRRTSSAAF